MQPGRSPAQPNISEHIFHRPGSSFRAVPRRSMIQISFFATMTCCCCSGPALPERLTPLAGRLLLLSSRGEKNSPPPPRLNGRYSRLTSRTAADGLFIQQVLSRSCETRLPWPRGHAQCKTWTSHCAASGARLGVFSLGWMCSEERAQERKGECQKTRACLASSHGLSSAMSLIILSPKATMSSHLELLQRL